MSYSKTSRAVIFFWENINLVERANAVCLLLFTLNAQLWRFGYKPKYVFTYVSQNTWCFSQVRSTFPFQPPSAVYTPSAVQFIPTTFLPCRISPQSNRLRTRAVLPTSSCPFRKCYLLYVTYWFLSYDCIELAGVSGTYTVGMLRADNYSFFCNEILQHVL